MTAGLAGVVVVDKPAGPTSHDVVARVRNRLRTRRAGHTGTLDPFATGVLPVCLGAATRLARFLSGGEKEYRATVRLGFATTTDDATGEPLASPRAVTPDSSALLAACHALTGEILQVPPAFSARHVAGKRLYQWARRGVAVQRPPARVTVHALEIVETREQDIDVVVRCSPGTYIRSLARDLGEALGCGAHLAALRRTRSGEFGLEEAVAWDEIDERCLPRLRPLESLLTALPAISLNAEGREAVRHGGAVFRRHATLDMPSAERVRLLDDGGHLLALGVPAPEPGGFRPDVVLIGPSETPVHR
jgi:tRNA pseudouridine55 synthase